MFPIPDFFISLYNLFLLIRIIYTTSKGKPESVVLSLEDWKKTNETLRIMSNKELIQSIRRAKKRFQDKAAFYHLKRFMEIYKTYFLLDFFKQAKKHRHLKKMLANKIKLLLKNPYGKCKSERLGGLLKDKPFHRCHYIRNVKVSLYTFFYKEVCRFNLVNL